MSSPFLDLNRVPCGVQSTDLSPSILRSRLEYKIKDGGHAESNYQLPSYEAASCPNKNTMELAFAEARNALDRGEVPIGCVLQNKDGQTIAVGSNRTNELKNATSHAELVAFEALSEAGHKPEHNSLTLYVTCEPCIMCASAIVQIGIVRHVVFGCPNPRFGGCGSVKTMDLYGNNVPTVEGGVMAEEGVRLLSLFYERTNPHAPNPKKKRKKNVQS